MILQHNMESLSIYRNFKIVSSQEATNTERLSTGYKINYSSDNAAGLSISEKMRGQIRGLDQATDNLQNGISLVQTAEGALNEVTSILQRMRELSVQSANDINSETDRKAIQKEIDELKKEIDRIGAETEFNTIKIFQGSKHTTTFKVEDTTLETIEYTGGIIGSIVGYSPNNNFDDSSAVAGRTSKTLDFSMVNATNKHNLKEEGFKFVCTLGCKQEFAFIFKDDPSINKIEDTTPSSIISSGGVHNSKIFHININDFNTGKELVDMILNYTKNNLNNSSGYNVGHDTTITKVSDTKLAIYGSGISGEFYAGAATKVTTTIPGYSYSLTDYEDYKFHIQCGPNSYQDIMIQSPIISSTKLGIYGLNVMSHKESGESIKKIDYAISNINQYRVKFGAVQNRMEHAISVDSITMENLQNAESKIRDTDIAEEIVKLSKNNILMETGTSILSQANQSKEQILNLLRI